ALAGGRGDALRLDGALADASRTASGPGRPARRRDDARGDGRRLVLGGLLRVGGVSPLASAPWIRLPGTLPAPLRRVARWPRPLHGLRVAAPLLLGRRRLERVAPRL